MGHGSVRGLGLKPLEANYTELLADRRPLCSPCRCRCGLYNHKAECLSSVPRYTVRPCDRRSITTTVHRGCKRKLVKP